MKKPTIHKIVTLYTLQQLEPILEVSTRTLLQYIKDGKLKAVKIGGRWKVSEKNLQDYVNGQ